ncbi:hypothetical protein MITS9509_01847 [Synechococcus sp. MIT S9509]|nr:hypothetical protein MITS9509_01847 [Synechococcus sp. MIT S9509]
MVYLYAQNVDLYKITSTPEVITYSTELLDINFPNYA